MPSESRVCASDAYNNNNQKKKTNSRMHTLMQPCTLTQCIGNAVVLRFVSLHPIPREETEQENNKYKKKVRSEEFPPRVKSQTLLVHCWWSKMEQLYSAM